MDKHFPDAKVTSYKYLTKNIILPDPNDRHVLAAAIKSNAQYIVTENLKDFPKKSLPSNIQAVPLDQFLSILIAAHPIQILEAVKYHRNNLKNPPYTVLEYIEARKNEGLKIFATFLRKHINAI